MCQAASTQALETFVSSVYLTLQTATTIGLMAIHSFGGFVHPSIRVGSAGPDTTTGQRNHKEEQHRWDGKVNYLKEGLSLVNSGGFDFSLQGIKWSVVIQAQPAVSIGMLLFAGVWVFFSERFCVVVDVGMLPRRCFKCTWVGCKFAGGQEILAPLLAAVSG